MHLAGFGAMALAIVSASGIAVPLSIQVSLDEHDLGHAHTSMSSGKEIAAEIVNDIQVLSTQCDANTRMLQGLDLLNVVVWAPQVVGSYQSRGNEIVNALDRMRDADKISESESREIVQAYRDFTMVTEREMGVLIGRKKLFTMFGHGYTIVGALRVYESAMETYLMTLGDLVSSNEAKELQSQYRKVEENLNQAIQAYGNPDY